MHFNPNFFHLQQTSLTLPWLSWLRGSWLPWLQIVWQWQTSRAFFILVFWFLFQMLRGSCWLHCMLKIGTKQLRVPACYNVTPKRSRPSTSIWQLGSEDRLHKQKITRQPFLFLYLQFMLHLWMNMLQNTVHVVCKQRQTKQALLNLAIENLITYWQQNLPSSNVNCLTRRIFTSKFRLRSWGRAA